MQGTPLERPAAFGERAVLTDEEFTAREETSQRQSEADGETTVVQRPRRGGGTGPPASTAARHGKPRSSSIRGRPHAAERIWVRMIAASPRGTLTSMLPTGDNMGTQIFQIPGFVVVRNEMIHETCVIPLDSRPHVGSKLKRSENVVTSASQPIQ